MTGTLYVVPTPIGNLEDITQRALRVLREVDVIAAEDTRHSRKLLTHYGIGTRLVSYHQHTKRTGLGRILEALETGDVALISDSGTPSISDPGYELVCAALEAGYHVTTLPGPSAVVTAVVDAALPARGFVFMGFLPRSKGDRESRLNEVARLPYSLVFFEAPSRVVRTLQAVLLILGDRQVVAVREMTKIHEEAMRGTVSEVLARFQTTEPRGEFTIVVAPDESAQVGYTDEEIAEALRVPLAEGSSVRDAVQLISQAFGVPRTDVYRVWIQSSRDSDR